MLILAADMFENSNKIPQFKQLYKKSYGVRKLLIDGVFQISLGVFAYSTNYFIS